MVEIETLRSLAKDKLSRLIDRQDLVLVETLLIRDGYYCGRRFTSGSYQALYLIVKNELTILDSNGKVLETIPFAKAPEEALPLAAA